MIARSALIATAALVWLVGSLSAAAAPAPETVYRVRPDTRMCPSPRCGGFWASRVNRQLTPCRGGRQLSSCYVTAIDLSALPRGVQTRVRPAVSARRALVVGSFAAVGTSQLAKLVATGAWIAGGTGRETGTVAEIVDTGIVCVRAPCFSLRGSTVNQPGSFLVSGLDLSGTGATPAVIARAHAALRHGGILAAGSVQDAAKPAGGRTFVATQVWLPATA